AKHYRLPVPDAHARGHFTRAEHRLIDNIRSKLNRLRNRYAGNAINTDSINRAAIVDEALELHNLRDEVDIDSRIISAYDRLDFQSDASISGLTILRRCRSYNHWNN